MHSIAHPRSALRFSDLPCDRLWFLTPLPRASSVVFNFDLDASSGINGDPPSDRKPRHTHKSAPTSTKKREGLLLSVAGKAPALLYCPMKHQRYRGQRRDAQREHQTAGISAVTVVENPTVSIADGGTDIRPQPSGPLLPSDDTFLACGLSSQYTHWRLGRRMVAVSGVHGSLWR